MIINSIHMWDRHIAPANLDDLILQNKSKKKLDSHWSSVYGTELHDHYHDLLENICGISPTTGAKTVVLITDECNIYWKIVGFEK